MAKERQSEIKFQCACGVVSILFVLNCVFWETKARTVNSIKDNKVQNVALKSSLIIPSNELACPGSSEAPMHAVYIHTEP
ncbi:hypothetical protein C0J52_11584 [Blattella germanica]|nr:hypothetical protein C0J52_11584 [Blattella germanica]